MSESSERFSGFPASRLAFTPLPSVFFSRLLPQIDDLAELKVTLHLFWLLHNKKGEARYARWEELAEDRTLLAGLEFAAAAPGDALATALERAVARGTVLHVALESPAGGENLYFLNTGEGRQAVARLRRGELAIAPLPPRPAPARQIGGRSPVVALYEQHIGLLTPTIAQELAQAEHEHGPTAVAEAVGEAVRYNKRHWAYIRRVLENRQRQTGGALDDGQTD